MGWRTFVLFLVAVFCAVATDPAGAATTTGSAPAAPAVTPDEARQALAVLQDDAARAKLIQTLHTIAEAAPVETKQQATPSAETGNLGSALLLQSSHWLKDSSHEFIDAARSVTDFPLLWGWMQSRLADPDTRAELFQGALTLALVFGAGVIAQLLAWYLLTRPRDWLASTRGLATPAAASGDGNSAQHRRFAELQAWLRRLPFALLVLLIDLVPLAAFAGAANLVMGALVETADTARLVIVAATYAWLLWRGIIAGARALTSPTRPALRLLPVGDAAAAYLLHWTGLIAGVAVLGFAAADVAQLLGLAQPGYDALLRVVLLIVHVLIAVVIFSCRHEVAAYIHSAEETGPLSHTRNRLAAVWHYPAIFAVIGLWAVWAFGLNDGYIRLLYFGAVTILVLIAGRLLSIAALAAVERVLRPPAEGPAANSAARLAAQLHADRYYTLVRGSISVLIGCITAVALLQAWGLDTLDWFQGHAIGGRLVSAVGTIGIASAIAAIVWEVSNVAVEREMGRLTRRQDLARVARLQTLLPMLRTALLATILIVVGLTAMSQIGINIGPLLASAGIVGVALGFGSQKLVQDFINGVFLLLENAMQVGDWVTVAGLSGSVEHLSVRTIRLRAGDGSVHLIPFSSVTSVTNTNRGIGNAAVSVNVPFSEDTERVAEVMKEIALEMRQEAPFKDAMQSDLQYWGVDKVDASVVTLVGQIVCTDAGRWAVQREYNRRLKLKFQELGIAIANPTHTIVLEAQGKGEGSGAEATVPLQLTATATATREVPD